MTWAEVIMNNYAVPPITFSRGSGTELFDVEGNRYLDFLSGLAVTSLGHSHPRIAKALARQSKTLLHTSNLFATQPQVEVAHRLDSLIRSGIGEPGRVLFQNSGAETIEASIKLVRRFHGLGRHGIVSAERSFHGRTFAALAATGQPEKHQPFKPLPEGFRLAVWNDLESFSAAIDPSIGAILVEPLQGEGGVNPADRGFLEGLRSLCDEHGLLLVIDEVQTGLGRTGEWFCHHHYGIQADIVTVAKALGNGVPIGAVWAKPEIADAFKPGDHGSTFAGQPLAASAAREVLDVLVEIDAPKLAAQRGAELVSALNRIDGVDSVRGLGLLLGVELESEFLQGRTASDIAKECLEAGLIVNGVTSTALRLAPPLTITSDEINEGVNILDSVLTAYGVDNL